MLSQQQDNFTSLHSLSIETIRGRDALLDTRELLRHYGSANQEDVFHANAELNERNLEFEEICGFLREETDEDVHNGAIQFLILNEDCLMLERAKYLEALFSRFGSRALKLQNEVISATYRLDGACDWVIPHFLTLLEQGKRPEKIGAVLREFSLELCNYKDRLIPLVRQHPESGVRTEIALALSLAGIEHPDVMTTLLEALPLREASDGRLILRGIRRKDGLMPRAETDAVNALEALGRGAPFPGRVERYVAAILRSSSIYLVDSAITALGGLDSLSEVSICALKHAAEADRRKLHEVLGRSIGAHALEVLASRELGDVELLKRSRHILDSVNSAPDRRGAAFNMLWGAGLLTLKDIKDRVLIAHELLGLAKDEKRKYFADSPQRSERMCGSIVRPVLLGHGNLELNAKNIEQLLIQAPKYGRSRLNALALGCHVPQLRDRIADELAATLEYTSRTKDVSFLLGAFCTLRTVPDRAVAPIVDLLSNGEREMKLFAAYTLGLGGNTASEVQAALTLALLSPDTELSAMARSALLRLENRFSPL